MAVDEALMESVRAGAAPALRMYEWSPSCLSLGRNQPASAYYDREHLRAVGVDVVRRPTGGRAVLHDAELTYSVVARDGELGPPRRAYLEVNEALIAGLSLFGVDAAIHRRGPARSPIPSTAPCFAEPVAGEVLAKGRKLIGSAQLRAGGVLLQHGSIPMRPSQLSGLVGGVAGEDSSQRDSPAYLDLVVGRPTSIDDLVQSLTSAWAARVGPLETVLDLNDREFERVSELEAKYRDELWTWRR